MTDNRQKFPSVAWGDMRKFSNGGYVLVGLVSVAIATLIVFAGDRAILSWTDDDSHYYFETARNWTKTGVTTFDLVTTTNGYQPLWFLMITPFFAFTDSEIVPLRLVLVLQVFILAGSSLLAYSLVMRLAGDWRAALLASVVLFYPAYINQMVSGMETGIGVLLVLFFLVSYFRWATNGYTSTHLRFLVAISLALVPLARVDLLFFSAIAIIGIACQIGLSKRNWRSVFGNMGPVIYLPVAVFGLYVISNVLFYEGGLLPISGAVKSDFSTIRITDFELWTSAARVWWSGLLPDLGFVFYLAPLVIGLAALAVERRSPNRFLRFALYATSIGYLAQLIALHLFLRWRGISEWWFVLAPVVVVLLIAWLEENSQSLHRTALRAFQIGKVTVTILFAVLAVAWSANFLIRVPQASSHELKRDVAVRLQEIEGAVFAMGDGAGSMGYFLDKPVIHLEGFVANREYLDALESGRINQFLTDNGVTHLIAFNESAPEIVSGNYSIFERIEPSHPAWKGATSTITVTKENEILREYWRQGNRQVVFVVWRLQR